VVTNEVINKLVHKILITLSLIPFLKVAMMVLKCNSSRDEKGINSLGEQSTEN
jgi:hypothetical protein